MKKFVVLVVLIAVAAGGVLWYRGQTPPVPASDAWPEYRLKDIHEISVKGPAGAYVLTQTNGQWRIKLAKYETAPLALKERVATFVDFLNHNRPIRRLAYGQGRIAASDVVATVAVDGHNRLTLGGMDDSEIGVLARWDQGDSFVLVKEYLDFLGRDPATYLDLQLMNEAPGWATVRVGFSNGDTWSIARDKDKSSFTAPEALTTAKVEQGALDLWIHDVVNARGLGLSEEPAQGSAVYEIVLDEGKKGREQWLRAFAPAQKDGPWSVLTSRQGMYFLLDPDQSIKLQRTAFSLVDRHIAAVDLGRVAKLVLFALGRELRATKHGKIWTADKTQQRMTGIDMLLWRLTELQYEYGPVGALPATAEKKLRLELLDADNARVLEIFFFADADLPAGKCWAAVEGVDGFHPLSDQLFKDLQGLLPSDEAQAVHK